MPFQFLLCALTSAALLLLWFRTHAPVEYAGMIGLAGLFRLRRWVAERDICTPEQKLSPAYLPWLARTYPGNFFVRLVTCHFCLGLWISLAVCLCFGHWQWTLAIYFCALTLFGAYNRARL